MILYIFEESVLCQKEISRTGISNHIPQILWSVITCPCPWYLRSHRYCWMWLLVPALDTWDPTDTVECDYLSLPLIPEIPQIMWNVITCPCPWYLRSHRYYGMWLLVPALDTWDPTDTVECDYLSLPLIPEIPQILWNVITCPCPWYLRSHRYYGMWLLVPALDTWDPTDTVECDYLSLPLIPEIPQILWNVITCPCPWYLRSHRYYGMWLLVPALDTCFWHSTPHLSYLFFFLALSL